MKVLDLCGQDAVRGDGWLCAHLQILQETEFLRKQHEQRAALSMASTRGPAGDEFAVDMSMVCTGEHQVVDRTYRPTR